MRRLNRILGRASEETKVEAEVRKSGTDTTKRQIILLARKGKNLIGILIETLYRFEGSTTDSSYGGLAQLEERVLCKHEVIGSSPIFSTIWADSSVG